MNKFQRIRQLIVAFLMIFCSVLLIMNPYLGYYLMLLILAISLIVIGIRRIAFYNSMARNMVGGRSLLYQGLIIMDLGFFTLTLNYVPETYIMLYLQSMYMFSGVVDILRAVEAKRNGASAWKLKMTHGAVKVVLALVGGSFTGRTEVVVIMYAAALIYSAVIRITETFRKTAIVYIQ